MLPAIEQAEKAALCSRANMCRLMVEPACQPLLSWLGLKRRSRRMTPWRDTMPRARRPRTLRLPRPNDFRVRLSPARHCATLVRTANGCYEGINMARAALPNASAFVPADDILPTRHGDPFKLRVASKTGVKEPQFVMALHVTNRQPSGLWSNRGYNWLSGM